MDNQLEISSFSKAILSGLLTGIIAAILNMIYVIAYREATHYGMAEVVTPLTVFVGFPILLVMAGYIYYLLQKHLHAGTTWFILLSIAFMCALLGVTYLDTTEHGGALFSGLRGLCLGMEIITCLLGAFMIPYFARHPKIYQ